LNVLELARQVRVFLLSMMRVISIKFSSVGFLQKSNRPSKKKCHLCF
jgi:hypothetical protein